MRLCFLITSIISVCFLRLSASNNSKEDDTEDVDTEIKDISHRSACFDCSDEEPIIIQNPNSTLNSLTLNSPCYERSSTECTTSQSCTITIQNMPKNMWIGMFFDTSSSESPSSDKLTVSTGDSSKQFESSLSDITSGLFCRYVTSVQPKSLSLTLTTFADILTGSASPNSLPSPNYQFTLDIKYIAVASCAQQHWLGSGRESNWNIVTVARSFDALTEEQPRSSHSSSGFIVSHFRFDNSTDTSNHYPESINKSIFVPVKPNHIIRLTFLALKLHRSLNPIFGFCDDYLQINEVLGGPMDFCGYDNPTGSYVDLYPTNTVVKLQFRSRKIPLFSTTSTGFLIKFEEVSFETIDCPPVMQNAKQPKDHPYEDSRSNNRDIHIIECREGYWTGSNTSQMIDCNNDGWRSSILPCILIECELPKISNSSELNFTLSSTGRATVGTNISYSCNSERYELTEGTEISTCMPDGEWNSPVPSCTLIVQSTPPETTSTTIAQTTESFLTKSSRHALEGNSSTQASVQGTEAQSGTNKSVGGYIGAGVGVAISLIVVVVVILLMRRRRSRSHKHQGIAGSKYLDNCQPNYPQSNGEIYSLADDGLSGDRTRTLPEVYELAGPIEVLDEQSLKSPSKPASEKTAVAHSGMAAAGSAGAYVDLSVAAGVYSLANEDETRIADQNGAPNATRNDEYELAGSIDNYELAGATDNYENANAIERTKREQDVSEDYGSVLADRKTNKSNPAADVMVENELYGS